METRIEMGRFRPFYNKNKKVKAMRDNLQIQKKIKINNLQTQY